MLPPICIYPLSGLSRSSSPSLPRSFFFSFPPPLPLLRSFLPLSLLSFLFSLFFLLTLPLSLPLIYSILPTFAPSLLPPRSPRSPHPPYPPALSSCLPSCCTPSLIRCRRPLSLSPPSLHQTIAFARRAQWFSAFFILLGFN
jgi:hypothetical protein